jgi:phosphoribosyl 1,2-cyclic phosphodiesterase
MHLQILSSGSKGNSTLVRAGETNALVDAGLTGVELDRRLERARLPARRVGHVVLTHGHLDHARGAGVLSKRTGARVLCCERLMNNNSLRGAARLATLHPGRRQPLPGPNGEEELFVTGVKIPHDADPTVAVRLEHGERTAVVLTDMGRPDPDAQRALGGAHLLVLEFNHDADLLRDGPYPRQLKKRVAGDYGHLSNDQAADVLAALCGPELHTLVLAHLSETNNTPEIARAVANDALRRLGRTDVRVLVASQDEVGENLEV